MTDEALRERLVTGCALLFDTNAIYGNRLVEVANTVNQLNEVRSGGPQISLMVSPLAYAERQAQERRRRGETFDAAIVLHFLRSKGVKVHPLDEEVADGIADWLVRRAPDDAAWQRLKWSRVAEVAGLETGERSPRIAATVDWFIGGHAAAQGMVLVTDDQGLEFESVERATRAQLKDALDGLLRQLSTPR